MKYAKLNNDIVNILKQICGEKYVFTETADKEKYAKDETEDLFFMPETVVKPATANEIAEILKIE